MSKNEKTKTLEENRKNTPLKKQHIINKKSVFIIIGLVLLLVIILVVVILLNREEKTNNSPKENEAILDDNTQVFEEKGIDEQKTILLDILNQEIAKYEEICLDSANEECITEEKKTEILNKFNSFKERLEDEEEINQENIDQLKQELNDYLLSLDPEVKLDDLINEETKTKENTTTNEEDKSKESTPSSVASGIEGILNGAKLNPTKTGYTPLDNKVSSVINSVTNSSMSTYEKVKAVYDWVINNMSYQLGFVIEDEINALINNYGFYEKDAIQVFLAYNSFETKKGSCDNYSAMFMVLTRRIGLDSYVVSARNSDGSGHTTVNIKINGKWYNFDTQREDKSLKNGKIMYYAFGEDDNDSKPYTYINRNSDVKAFHAFNKQPEENYLKATITIAGKSYTAKTSVSGYKYVIPDTIEIDYATNPTTYINIETNKKVNYIHKMSDNTSTNYVWETVSGDRGTINTSGSISITQKWGALRYEIIHLEDDLGRELNFVVRVNYRDPSKQFAIEQQVADFSYTDYVDLGVTIRDSVGEVTLSGKVIETNDPKGANAIVVEKSPFYDLRVSNLDRSQYYYVVEITGIDEAGNKATDIVNITVKS